jgi:hypothetical protein
MPARAIVPGEAIPQHPPLSGPWAPPTGAVDASPTVDVCESLVGAGHARESDRSG